QLARRALELVADEAVERADERAPRAGGREGDAVAHPAASERVVGRLARQRAAGAQGAVHAAADSVVGEPDRASQRPDGPEGAPGDAAMDLPDTAGNPRDLVEGEAGQCAQLVRGRGVRHRTATVRPPPA